MKHRWPKSIHSQVEAVFHSIRSIRRSKVESNSGVRSFGVWTVYRIESHKFAEFMIRNGVSSILEAEDVATQMNEYLQRKLDYYVENRKSRQTLETVLSALGKLAYAINNYAKWRKIDVVPLDVEEIRMAYYAKCKQLLPKSSRLFGNRAFPDPLRLIARLPNHTFQLQACLQYEGGMRTEGVGAPSSRKLENPLTPAGLRGIGADPVTGKNVGIVATVEKGGKETEHFVSVATYNRLEKYLSMYGKLESSYREYVKAINTAALATGQHATGRGSHGLKHCFVQERYRECVMHGLTHEQALQQASLEASHFRMSETLTYTRG